MEKVENKDKVMKTSLVVLVAVVIIFAGALVFAGKKATPVNQDAMAVNNSNSNSRPQVKESLKNAIVNIGGNHLTASVASSESSRMQGLSGVKSMGPNEGKMFTFDQEDFYTFHMKGMKFALDFIFVNDQGTVVDIVSNINADYDGVIKPAYPASTVYEVNAGWAVQNNIKVGDTVSSTIINQI